MHLKGVVECSSNSHYYWTWHTSVFKDISNKKTHRRRHLISFCLLWDPDMLQHGPIALAMTSWPKLCTCEFRGFNQRVSRGIQPTCNLSTFKSNIQRILMKTIEMTATHAFFQFKELDRTLMPQVDKTTSMQFGHDLVHKHWTKIGEHKINKTHL